MVRILIEEEGPVLQRFSIVLGLLVAASLLSACSAGGDTVLFDDGSLKADSRLEEILDAISVSDSDELENMFSTTALSQVSDFKEQANSLFQLFQGTVESWERTGFTSPTSIEAGEKITQSISWYDVTNDKMTYVFLTIECIEDTKDPDNVGLCTLAIVKKSEEDSKLTYWQDMQFPGIYIP